MKVLFLTNIPAPYRVDFFNEWGKRCELTVLFESRRVVGRSAQWQSERAEHYTAAYLEGQRVKGNSFFCPGVLGWLRRGFDRIVIGNYSTPTAMLAIEYLRARHIPFWIEADGGMVSADSRLKYAVKRHYLAAASGWLSSGATTTAYLVHYGAAQERVHWYPFTSLFAADLLPQPPTAAQKRAARRELGLDESSPLVLGVGQFIPRKGFDVLLDAWASCPPAYRLCLVGAEAPPEYRQKAQALRLQNVRFVGFCPKEKLKVYYLAADLFVLPTRKDIWGLVINEAMAHALPVITTDRCVAGRELVKDGENGYLVPAEDAAALAQRMQCVLADPALQARMARTSLDKIRPYTIENMAQVHQALLEENE